MIEVETLVGALLKAAAALDGAHAALDSLKALAEQVRAVAGEDDRAKISGALAALQAQNEADFVRIETKLGAAAQG